MSPVVPLVPRGDRQGLGRAVRFLCCSLGMAGWVASAVEAVPAERDFVVRAWRKEHGLPGNRITCLHLAGDGFLWVGTANGLTRFDGHQFRTWPFISPPGLPAIEGLCLAEEPDGGLLVGTSRGLFSLRTGLHALDLGSAGAPAPISAPSPAPAVPALAVGPDGTVWAATTSGLLRRTPGAPWTREELPGGTSAHPPILAGHAKGPLWAASAGELLRRRESAPGWEAVPTATPPAPHTVVEAVFAAPDGTSFALVADAAGGTRRLHRFEQGEWRSLATLDAPAGGAVTFLAARSADEIWLSWGQEGVACWSSGRLAAYSLASLLGGTPVLCAATDEKGGLWLGTRANGLLCLQPRRLREASVPAGFLPSRPFALVEAAPGALWAATATGILPLATHRDEPPAPAPRLADGRVQAFAADAHGGIWIGQADQLRHWESGPVTDVPSPGGGFGGRLQALFNPADDTLWVATSDGLHRRDPTGWRTWTTADGLPSADIRVLLVDRGGRVWLGTEGEGLACLVDGRPALAERLRPLPGRRVRALLEDAEGRIWIGTDHGLSCLHPEGVTSLGPAQGLPGGAVHLLLDDGLGGLWLGQDHGLGRVPWADLEAVVNGSDSQAGCLPCEDEDAPPSRRFAAPEGQPAALRLRDGRLAFASPTGVTLVDPRQHAELERPVPARILRVACGGVVLFDHQPGQGDAQRSLLPLRVLPAHRSPVEIAFTAPVFRAGDQTRFRYRMLGLDSRWLDTGNSRQVSFAHLRPGRYSFEVAVIHADRRASAIPDRLDLELVPRFTERDEVHSGVGLLLITGITLGVRWRLKELRRIERLEYQNALARERERLARDLHDGLGARLTEIALLSGGDDAGDPSGGTLRGRLETLAARSAEALGSLRELIWTANPRADTLESLIGRLADQAERLLRAASITPRLLLPPTLPRLPVGPAFRRQVLLATLEAVNNAVRHARPRRVAITVTCDRETLGIEIHDDGAGFDPDGPPRRGEGGLGLESMRDRLESLGGGCEVHSVPGQGCRVMLRAPLPPLPS